LPGSISVAFTSRVLRSVWASLSCGNAGLSSAACSGQQATPGSLGRLRTPWAAFSAPGLTRYQQSGIAAGAFAALGSALIFAVSRFHRRRFQPRGSPGSDVSLTTLLCLAAPASSGGVLGMHATPAPFRLGQCPPVASTPAPGSHTSSASCDHSQPVLTHHPDHSGAFLAPVSATLSFPLGRSCAVAFNLTVPALRYGPL